MKNILIIGLGSIGQRHYRNLKNINNKFKFYAIVTKNNSPELNKRNIVVNKTINFNKLNIIKTSFNNLMNLKIDLAIISNPTSKHIDAAIKIAKLKIPLYIEKPISSNLKNVDKLRKLLIKNKVLCFSGYQQRENPSIQYIKNLINSGKYGKIIKVIIKNQEFLPFQHKYENYKNGYAARQDLGGGVTLCLSHEVDYANLLFGKQINLLSIGGKRSNLKINVDDTSDFIINYELNKKRFPVYFFLDFIKKKTEQSCEILFEKADLKLNLRKNLIKINTKKNEKIIKFTKDRDYLFMKRLKRFISLIKKKRFFILNFDSAIKVLKICLKIKQRFYKNNKSLI